MSRIGRKPIALPKGATVSLKDNGIFVKGPKGELSMQLVEGITVALEEGQVVISRADDEKQTRAFHGLVRALLANMVAGVTTGFEKKLEIVGIGYRAEFQPGSFTFYLGYSHPIIFTLPEGITGALEKQTQVSIQGIDKELVGQVAAKIRALRKPDAYKNKGVKYANEVLRKKAGKSGK